MKDCCSVNGLDRQFNESWSRKELKSYREKGLAKRAGKLTDFLKTQDLSGATLLEIGCGIGALHQELLRDGAAKATGVDVSSAYIEAAKTLAQEQSSQDSVEYHVGDFVELEPQIPNADIVLLDRVICCYPDMNALVTASGQHAQRLCALTYPRWTWWIRAGKVLLNFGCTLLRRRFRIFIHNPNQVSATLGSQGFAPVFRTTSGVWEIAVYGR